VWANLTLEYLFESAHAASALSGDRETLAVEVVTQSTYGSCF
jgi:hypothetical protein